MKKLILVFILVSVLGSFTSQVEPYQIGDEVKDFRLLALNNKNYSLASYPSSKAFIIVFMSNYCPFSRSYEDRLNNLDRKYTVKGASIIGVISNDANAYEQDSPENFKKRAQEKGFNFPVLIDDKQELCRMFGAERTPQVFLLKKQNNKVTLVYQGAIDDNPQDAAGVMNNYLEDALINVLQNKSLVLPITKPIGCAIKLK